MSFATSLALLFVMWWIAIVIGMFLHEFVRPKYLTKKNTRSHS